ncbi:histidine phosphatase family protein [Erysipelotrichaceae bacterium 51-3]|uniref:histidine phosphatase family protein n=1 Tax=Allobaculum sp. JKK-2023 TaxID=3108943 RepID=UPI002B0573E0|nr:histidine phosphatase family protein [Allobaculum sp. JKK-2023]
MKKKLYLVRHGQTLFNEKNLIQGWCDSPLTPLGHKQARAVRKWLDEHHIEPDSYYCSTLGRTEQTIQEITDQPYTRVPGLKEFHYGTLEGEPISKGNPGGKDPAHMYVPFGGEAREEVEKRMVDTLTDIMEKDPGHTILACAHGACSFRFANAIDPKKAKKLRKFDNCIIYDFDYEDGKFTLNDIINEHVKDLKPDTPSQLSVMIDQ